MEKSRFKEIVRIILILCVISMSLFVMKRCMFLVVERTNFSDRMASMLSMSVLVIIGCILCKKYNIQLSIFPKKFSAVYVIVSIISIMILICTPSNFTGGMKAILILIYGSVITPIFEELIFRGFVWNRLEKIFKSEWSTYIITICLFALWHLGYVDSIGFRVKEGLLNVMIWKVITGFCFGIILGLVRKKTKNCYSTILAHGFMNIFGK